MKNKNTSRRMTMTLGDLVSAVAASASSQRETMAAVVDLLESGRVRMSNHGKMKRVHVVGFAH